MAKLMIDRRTGVFCTNETHAVSREDVAHFVRRLDAKTHTCFSIESEEVEGLVHLVGGGSGQFVVTRQMFQERFWSLINTTGNETDTVDLCVGGQYGDYPSKIVVGYDLACRATEDFLSRASDTSLIWEET